MPTQCAAPDGRPHHDPMGEVPAVPPLVLRPLLVSNLLCFWIPVGGYGAKLAWGRISYALMGLLYSLVNIPFGSLAGAMSQNPIDRSRLASARMVGSGTTILLLAIVLAPQIKASDNLAMSFLVTAAAFLVVGSILFFITFATARETVVREVPQVSFRHTMHADQERATGPALRVLAVLPHRAEHHRRAGHLRRHRYPGQYDSGNWLATVVTIITTGAVIYVAPFGPVVTRRLGKKHGF